MNESGSASKVCGRCGATLPSNAPEGLCPRCLGALNLAGETVFTETEAPRIPPPSPEQIAAHFPQLEIVDCLGRGGMGVVYKARQKSLGRLVALKLLAPEREKDPQFAERFAREAQALAQLDHPHIVTVYDFGQTNGYFYLLMEFVDGVNLRQLLQARKLTPEEALAIVPPLCEALQFAHDRGIVHRDIKPENLLLAKDGRVKVADFGIAKMLGDEAQIVEEKAAGTPGYMAPEQRETPQRVDSRADIYSLGVVFYEMLTGELPAQKLVAPSRKVAVDVRIDEVVLRALERSPDMRWQTAAEMRTGVEEATSAKGAQAPTSCEVPRSRWLLLPVVAIMGVACGLLSLWLFGRFQFAWLIAGAIVFCVMALFGILPREQQKGYSIPGAWLLAAAVLSMPVLLVSAYLPLRESTKTATPTLAEPPPAEKVVPPPISRPPQFAPSAAQPGAANPGPGASTPSAPEPGSSNPQSRIPVLGDISLIAPLFNKPTDPNSTPTAQKDLDQLKLEIAKLQERVAAQKAMADAKENIAAERERDATAGDNPSREILKIRVEEAGIRRSAAENAQKRSAEKHQRGQISNEELDRANLELNLARTALRLAQAELRAAEPPPATPAAETKLPSTLSLVTDDGVLLPDLPVTSGDAALRQREEARNSLQQSVQTLQALKERLSQGLISADAYRNAEESVQALRDTVAALEANPNTATLPTTTLPGNAQNPPPISPPRVETPPANAPQTTIAADTAGIGIGLVLKEENGRIIIERILPDSPAATDGSLKPGHEIRSIGDSGDQLTSIAGWKMGDVVARLRGKEGTQVSLLVVREGVETIVTLIRRHVPAMALRDEPPKAKENRSEPPLNPSPLQAGNPSIPMQLEFEVIKVEHPKDTRDIVLHFKRDPVFGLAFEVYQDWTALVAGSEGPSENRKAELLQGGVKTWVSASGGEQALRWLVPDDFSNEALDAPAAQMEREWKGSRRLAEGAAPVFANLVHADGWRLRLRARVVREPGSPHPPAPDGALFTAQRQVIAPPASHLTVVASEQVNNGKENSVAQLSFKTAPDSGNGILLRWRTFGSDHSTNANRWLLDLIDPQNGIIFHRIGGDLPKGANVVSPEVPPLPGNAPADLHLTEPNSSVTFRFLRAEFDPLSPQFRTRRGSIECKLTVTLEGSRSANHPPTFQLPRLAAPPAKTSLVSSALATSAPINSQTSRTPVLSTAAIPWELRRYVDVGDGLIKFPLLSTPSEPPMIVASGEQKLTAFRAGKDGSEIIWQFNLDAPLCSAPVRAEKMSRIFFGTADKQFHALDARGRERWKFAAGGKVVAQPVAAHVAGASDTIVFGCDDGQVYGLNAESGAVNWKFGVHASATSAPGPAGDLLVIGSTDGSVHALHPGTGDKQWSYITTGSINAPIVGAEGLVYLATNGGEVVALDAKTGDARWTGRLGASPDTVIAIGANRLFVVEAGRVSALALDSGKPLWQTPPAEYVGTPSFICDTVMGDTVIVTARPGTVRRLDATTGRIREEWKASGNEGQDAPIFSFGSVSGAEAQWLADEKGTIWRLGPIVPNTVYRR